MTKKKETKVEELNAVQGGVCPNCGKGKLTKRGNTLECSKCYAHYPEHTPTPAEKVAEAKRQLAIAEAEAKAE
ncbi:MAG: hypothetical protein GY861_16980 [bacterium]|nr:hypothetical protein [bacterium]